MRNKVISETDFAWAAGFIDGDGYIGIDKSHQRQMIIAAYTATIAAQNTNIEPIARLTDLFGGAIRTIPLHGFNKKPVYEWRAKGNIQNILKRLLPYLVAKREQAALVIRFLELKRSLARGGRKVIFPSEVEEIAWREELYLTIRELNAKYSHGHGTMTQHRQLKLIPRTKGVELK